MKQVLIKQGQAIIEDVPVPLVEPGTLLVRTQVSCISVGTELSGIRMSGTPLWKKAMAQPEKVRRVMDMVAEKGVMRTITEVQGRVETAQPIGYSAAGIVVGIGEGVEGFFIGERVACAGAQCAYHAEYIRVPTNLTVSIPDGVNFAQSSTVALGAIAMQGVRRASPTLGETFVVIGLGFLGQLVVQMLRANGCQVIAHDPDSGRRELSVAAGALALETEGNDIEQQVVRLTGGLGADGVIITAATASDAVIANAFHMCRKKGRVVLVGDVGLDIKRADIYEKELDFFISTSYGPGRYDERYEEHGLDYPASYVRWTENRNMQAYLALLGDSRLHIDSFLASQYQIEDASKAYDALTKGEKPLVSLLVYPERDVGRETAIVQSRGARAKAGIVRLSVIGAGEFATAVHLPAITEMKDAYKLQGVVNRNGHKSVAAAQRFGAVYATTDPAKILSDVDTDAVLICTRHDLHASQTLDALSAGKHVLVEKPLALNAGELDKVKSLTAGMDKPPVLLCGFNRRFSPLVQPIAAALANRSNPILINYRMNAGHIPYTHWVHGAEGGGRNIGEACHIYDLFTFLTQSEMENVTATHLRPKTAHYRADDNFVATIRMRDGSVATLTYTALGSSQHPKERMDVYADGKVFSLDDYKTLDVFGAGGGIKGTVSRKGHKEELVAFAHAIGKGQQAVPLWQTFQAMEIAFAVEADLRAGSVPL